jgi:hypothetical protein
MLIYGFRGTIDWSKVRAAFKKCTTMAAPDVERLIKNIKAGQTQQVTDDFVLHDELKELGLLVK